VVHKYMFFCSLGNSNSGSIRFSQLGRRCSPEARNEAGTTTGKEGAGRGSLWFHTYLYKLVQRFIVANHFSTDFSPAARAVLTLRHADGKQ
jgi:hypothetical protein